MKLKFWKFLVAGLVTTVAVMICNGVTLDNDSWYILAEGREIVENGIYYEDQLSMHEGLTITVQNYGFATIFYLLYSALGPVGIYIILLILNLILVFLLYKVFKVISRGNVNLSLLLAVLADLLLSRWFIVTRAQMVSFIFFVLVIYLLELYVSRKETKYLWFLPLISLVQINIHGAMWPMMLILIGVYIVDSFGLKKLHLDKYKTKPLILALLLSILVGFLNPYGVKMMTYIFTSFGVPEANDLVNEMKAFSPLDSVYSAILFSSVALTMMLIIFGKNNKNVKMRWLILIFGFLMLGMNSYRGMSYLILILGLPLAAVYQDFKVKKKYRKICWMEVSWAGIIGICGIVALGIIGFPEMKDGPFEELITAMDVLDEETASLNKNDLKIYVGYDHGGFLEYRGYKAYIDPRMETFLMANNGKKDIFQEYYNLEKGKMDREEFLERYDFDYLVTIAGERMNSLEGGGYEVFYESEEKTDNGEVAVKLWKRT